jgi:hypothetical protein
MPGKLQDQLPNKALSGEELRLITAWELRQMLKDPAFSPHIAYRRAAFYLELAYELPFPHPKTTIYSRVPVNVPVETLTGESLADLIETEFNLMCRRDYIFGTSGAYATAKMEIELHVQVAGAYTPNKDAKESGVIEGKPPLANVEGQSAVIGLRREVILANPNIDRINHDLPIRVQRATPPKPPVVDNPLPGEPPTDMPGIPGIETLEFKYDKTQFPPPANPIDSDISKQVAMRYGVPLRTE